MVDIDFIEKFFAEGKEYAKRGDPVQASEKFYKAVEECLKLLAERQRTPEYEEAQREGRWWTKLLERSARRLARETGEVRIKDTWAGAFALHVWGFHERSLTVEDVNQEIPYVEWFINYTKDYLKHGT